jgi:hypothetical protein
MNAQAGSLSIATVDAVRIELPVAGLGSRAYAFIIDWHIRAAAALVWLGAVTLIARYLGPLADWWHSCRLQRSTCSTTRCWKS